MQTILTTLGILLCLAALGLLWCAQIVIERETNHFGVTGGGVMNSLCDKGAMLDEYAAKKCSERWAVRHRNGHVRAHYKRLKDEAFAELQEHLNSCAHCSEHMARLA